MTTLTDAKQIIVNRSIGDFNGTSNFSADFDNPDGRHSNEFTLNEEVTIYADRDNDPATNKIFTGVIEGIDFTGKGIKEKLHLTGRDFGAVLQDMTVQPIVYTNQDAGQIAKNIIDNNAESKVTTNNVNTNTGTTLAKITFNQKNIFDALNQLAQLTDPRFVWYVDEDKDVHFEKQGLTFSGFTFDNTNITEGSFKTLDQEVFNKVWVYGDRVLTGATDIGGIGAGSILTLTDKPHNARVFVDDVLQEKGGILQMSDPATEIGLKYVVDFNEKNIVFVSGTTAGDNIPASGTSNVTVNYERKTPILKMVQDATSVTSYGPKTKILNDDNIKDFAQANDTATRFLAEHKDPKTQGKIKVDGVVNIIPGNTCLVNQPNSDVSNQVYDILNVQYNLTPQDTFRDSTTSLTLNKKSANFIDTTKDIMLRIKDIETGPLEGTPTILKSNTGSIGVQNHYEAYSVGIGSGLFLHTPNHNLIESTDSLIGDMRAGSILLASGGTF